MNKSGPATTSTATGDVPDEAPAADARSHGGLWSTFRRLGPAGPLAVISATLPALGGFVLLAMMAPLTRWLASLGAAGAWVYAAAFAVLAGLALLPTYAQAVLGGYAFRMTLGLPAALAGFVGGAAIGYVLGRWASRDRARQIIREHRRWQAVYDELLGGGFLRTLALVTLVRLPPNSPFAITNLVLAAARVHPAAYLLGTLIGMAPRTAVAVYIGSTIQDVASGVPRPWWLTIGGIVLAIAVVAYIGYHAKLALARVTERADVAGR